MCWTPCPIGDGFVMPTSLTLLPPSLLSTYFISFEAWVLEAAWVLCCHSGPCFPAEFIYGWTLSPKRNGSGEGAGWVDKVVCSASSPWSMWCSKSEEARVEQGAGWVNGIAYSAAHCWSPKSRPWVEGRVTWWGVWVGGVMQWVCARWLMMCQAHWTRSGTTHLLNEQVGMLHARIGQSRGSEVAGNGVQLSSSPTLGPCGHSRRRQLAVWVYVLPVVVVGSKEMIGAVFEPWLPDLGCGLDNIAKVLG